MNATRSILYLVICFTTRTSLSAQAPQLVESLATPVNERDFTVSPDGSEAYFTRSHFDNKTRFIVRAENVSGEWTNPEIASFSGRFNDLEPFFSPDGNRIYFASNRTADQKGVKGDFDIWYVEREPDGAWSEAVRLDAPINTDGNEYFPAVAASGNLYFTAEREDSKGAEDIYLAAMRADGTFMAPVSISENVNSTAYEFNAYVGPDETLLIFSSFGRPDGQGGGDLYYSLKDANGGWGRAMNLGEDINSASLDYCPHYDAGNGVLYFTSNREMKTPELFTLDDLEAYAFGIMNGYGNIYRVPWRVDSF